MTPDGYRLGVGVPSVLERFDPPAVIAAMQPSLRAEYVKALSQGGLKQAHEILGNAAGAAIRQRLLISQDSRDEIEKVMSNPRRGGRISPFIRSGGIPILPGSTVKGALRTAWLAGETRSMPPEKVRGLAARIKERRPGKTGTLSEGVQLAAFDCDQGRTEQDPFRDISVSDAPLEAEGTVIDRVHVANCNKEGKIAIGGEGGMQIHVERLAAIADAGVFAVKPFRIAITAPEILAVSERRNCAGARAEGSGDVSRAIPRRPPGLDELRRATNAHHTVLWFYERQRFYLGTRTDALMDELLLAFSLTAERERLEPSLEAKGAWLLKLGRYGHFESKSIEIDGMRYGERAPRRGLSSEFMSEGGSRTVARDAAGRLLPFGWVLLYPEAGAPKVIPRLNPPPRVDVRRPRRETPAATAGAVTSGQFKFRRGDRVTNGEEQATVVRDVRSADARMDIKYDDGDIEEVQVARWRRA
jgi:hypothetical protein